MEWASESTENLLTKFGNQPEPQTLYFVKSIALLNLPIAYYVH